MRYRESSYWVGSDSRRVVFFIQVAVMAALVFQKTSKLSLNSRMTVIIQ